MHVIVRLWTILNLAWLLVFLQPAYANGEHVHVGGIFLILLGGVVFLSSFIVVFYFLFRTPSPESEDEEDPEA